MLYNPADYPFIAALQSQWRLIRQEYLELDAPVLDLHRIGSAETYVERLLKSNGWTPSWQVGSADPNRDWLTYALSYHGMLPDDLPQRMPFTSRLLSRLRDCEVCALSLMRPSSFIKPHTHPEMQGRLLTLHIGLEAEPERSFLSVGGLVHEERNGGSVVFDGSQMHFAVNMSSFDRVVLYMEFSPQETRFVE